MAMGYAQQSQQRADIRKCIKPIGRLAGISRAKPGLHQGARGRKQKIGQPHLQGQQQQNTPRRPGAIGGLPPFPRRDGQGEHGEHDQDGMDHPLPEGRNALRQPMRIRIPAEQHHLKEQHTGGPNGWTTPEPGQDLFADDRLYLKQQKSADEDRRRRPPPKRIAARRLHRNFLRETQRLAERTARQKAR
jgi:hypothetical protein